MTVSVTGKRLTIAAVAALVFGLALALTAAAAPLRTAQGSESQKILEFETMFPVMGPWVGPANPIRGIGGAGLPWAIDEAEGELRIDGRLKVKVEGLVLADHPSVPEERRGTNPLAEFKAVVSCISHDMDGNVVTQNVSTEAFPATPEGDAEVDTMVMVPHPCLAPVVFVTTPGTPARWLAVTGH